MKTEYIVDFLIEDVVDVITFTNKKDLIKFINYYKTTKDYKEGMSFIIWKKHRGKIKRAWNI